MSECVKLRFQGKVIGTFCGIYAERVRFISIISQDIELVEGGKLSDLLKVEP